MISGFGVRRRRYRCTADREQEGERIYMDAAGLRDETLNERQLAELLRQLAAVYGMRHRYS